jgi:hypothetical protein
MSLVMVWNEAKAGVATQTRPKAKSVVDSFFMILFNLFFWFGCFGKGH